MHYTAMHGMHFVALSEAARHHSAGLAASQQMLAVIVAVLCFVIAAGFLLSLVPDPRREPAAAPAVVIYPAPETAIADLQPVSREPAMPSPRLMPAPLGGLGQPPRAAPAARLPVEGANGTHFVKNSAEVRSVRADAHYTRVHDGTRERMCPWSISEAEARLNPGLFVRVHRSHIVAIPHVTFVRKEGDGAVIELDGPSPHRVPVEPGQDRRGQGEARGWHDGTPEVFTSSRLRGEVDARSAAGEGDPRQTALAQTLPHPTFSPQDGEKEKHSLGLNR